MPGFHIFVKTTMRNSIIIIIKKNQSKSLEKRLYFFIIFFFTFCQGNLCSISTQRDIERKVRIRIIRPRLVTLESVSSVVTVLTISTAMRISSQRSIARPISSRICVYICLSDFQKFITALISPRTTPQNIIATHTNSKKVIVNSRKFWSICKN